VSELLRLIGWVIVIEILMGSLETCATVPGPTSPGASNAEVDRAVKQSRSSQVQEARAGVERLRALAGNGNKEAMLQLGNCYLTGRGTDKNPKLAYAEFLKAADSGSLEGMFETARCMLYGVGITKHPALGMKWLKKAADGNHREAIAELSEQCLMQYFDNEKVAREVRKWSERGIELGNARCRRVMGFCYQFGIALTADPKKAFQCYTQALRDGDANSAVNVALCHRDGIGTAINEKQALLILQKAATGSNALAIHHFAANLDELVLKRDEQRRLHDPLGFQKRVSRGKLDDEYKKEVVRQLERAVELKCTDSMNLLAIKKFLGQGCKKDEAAAYELALKSERAGNRDGICLLGECYEHGIGIAPNSRRAASLFGRAAKMGSAIAQYRYGLCLALGFGIQANQGACRQWMAVSSRNGCQPATQFLRELAENEERQLQVFREQIAKRHRLIAEMNEIAQDAFSNTIDRINRDNEESSRKIFDRLGY